jgi:two-component system alkaline phosphatase synthesis response regulator PhoP
MGTAPEGQEPQMGVIRMARGEAPILVVDDDTDIREVVTYKLEAAGFRTLTAGDGFSALDLAGRHRPRMILLDVAMPGLDGISVCRQLQADKRTAGIPVLMLSARSRPADIDLAFGSGADDYVTKPFSPAELLRRVQGLLVSARAW